MGFCEFDGVGLLPYDRSGAKTFCPFLTRFRHFYGVAEGVGFVEQLALYQTLLVSQMYSCYNPLY
jgi:hypothetical protein